MSSPYRDIRTKVDTFPYGGYIDPETLGKSLIQVRLVPNESVSSINEVLRYALVKSFRAVREYRPVIFSLLIDPAKPDPLAQLFKSYDRLKKELEQTKFSNALLEIVCEASNSSPTAVPGQKRQADSSNLRHYHSTTKFRKTHFWSHLSSTQPLLSLPPPQTEPVNLSSKSTIDNQPSHTPPSITPPSPTSSPISTTNMLAQLLILSGIFPHLLKMNPQLCSQPPSSSLSLWTPIGSLFAPTQQIQAAFYP